MRNRILNRDQTLEKIVKLVIFDPDASWEIIYEEAVARHEITKKEVKEEIRKRLGGDQPPFHGAGVPKHPLPSEGSGNISIPCPEKSEDEIK